MPSHSRAPLPAGFTPKASVAMSSANASSSQVYLKRRSQRSSSLRLTTMQKARALMHSQVSWRARKLAATRVMTSRPMPVSKTMQGNSSGERLRAKRLSQRCSAAAVRLNTTTARMGEREVNGAPVDCSCSASAPTQQQVRAMAKSNRSWLALDRCCARRCIAGILEGHISNLEDSTCVR